MKSRDEFKRQFYDELLGMAVRPTPVNDESARGLFIRERIAKINELMERMWTYLADEQKPAVIPQTNGKPLPARKP